MFVILEGPDGAGKSSLASAIAESMSATHSVHRAHHGPLKRDPLVEYVLDYEQYGPSRSKVLRSLPDAIVCDRHSVGEDVYGPLWRGKSQLTVAQRRWIELFLLSRGAVLVYVTQQLEVLEARVAKRGDELLRPGDLEKLLALYVQALRSRPTLVYAVAPEGDVSTHVTEILEHARRTAREARVLEAFRRYIGRPDPGVLLVGDQQGPNKARNPATLLPFGPWPGGSGNFLLEALPAAYWQGVGLVNAHSEDGQLEELSSLWSALRRPPIVALGRRAQRILQQFELPHAAVPHPAHARRFKHGAQDKYGALIKRVTGTELDTITEERWRG